MPPRPPCRCRTTFGDDARYAYLQGTSMATPMVAATAALMRHLNPDAVGRRDRARPQGQRAPPGRHAAGTPTSAGGSSTRAPPLARARDADRTAPTSRATRGHTRGRRVTLRWKGADAGPAGVRRSGLARYELWRSSGRQGFRRVLVTRRRSKVVTLVRGRRYRFYSVAVDHDGNREAAPARPDVTIRLR